MDTTEIVAIVASVGLLTPLLTAVVEQPQWSTRTRTALSVAVSIVVGIVTYIGTHGLVLDSPAAVVAVVIGVILASAAAYQTLWQPSGIARAVEHRTSPQE